MSQPRTESETDGSLWFFTSDEAPLAEELGRNPQVGLSYGAPDKDLYLSVLSRAELVRDEATAKELWNVFAQAWFPEGVDDPHTWRFSASTSSRPSTERTRSRR